LAETETGHKPGQESGGADNSGSARYEERIRRQGAFLQQFAKWGTIARAARAADVDRQRHYEWLKDDAAYKKLFLAVDEEITALAEDELTERALHGIEVVKTIAGVREVLREYDAQYLFFMLKARRPDKYRERTDVTIANLGDVVARLQAGRERAAKAGH
jgi:hypothetical protein